MKAKTRILLQAAVIWLAGFWVYWPAVRGDWLWDDPLEITKNSVLRDPAGLGKIWFAPDGFDYFPIKTAVQWLEWRLWGNRVAGYHLTNIALHLLSALLLWRLMVKMFAIAGASASVGAGAFGAWIGGLLFALHPMAVESVAWISELKNVLSLPLLLLAISAYIDYDRASIDVPERAGASGPAPGSAAMRRRALLQKHAYCRSLVCFFASSLCKTSGVMFPFVLLLYAWWRRNRISRADLRASAPFFAVSLLLGWVTMWFQHHRAMPGGMAVFLGGILARQARAGIAVAFYFSKAVFPGWPMPNYPRWVSPGPSAVQFFPCLVLGAVIAWFWTKSQNTTRSAAPWGRHALFGLGFFTLNLVPVLGFVPMAYLRISWVADHLAYLPLVGVIGLAAAAINAVRNRLPAAVLWSGTAAVTVALAYQSHGYAGIFQNDEKFWTYAARHNPEAWMAHYNLGNQLRQQGRMEEAIAQYKWSLRIQPDAPEVANDLGAALASAGRPFEAIGHFERALQIKAEFPDARKNLGTALAQTGRLAEAAFQFEAAVRLDPSDPESHYKLGLVLGALGRKREAEAQMQEAARLQARR